jgi:hypothetical protein
MCAQNYKINWFSFHLTNDQITKEAKEMKKNKKKTFGVLDEKLNITCHTPPLLLKNEEKKMSSTRIF